MKKKESENPHGQNHFCTVQQQKKMKLQKKNRLQMHSVIKKNVLQSEVFHPEIPLQ